MHSTLTRILVPAVLAILLPGSFAGAQSLADVIPASCLFYVRDDDPIGRFEKAAGSGDTWKDPKRVGDRTRRSMSKAFKEGDKALDTEEGTLDSWLRSVGSVELALFSFSIDPDMADMPAFDYAASFESPAAIEMFDKMGKMLIDQGMATKNERGDFVLGLGMDQTAHLAIHGTRVIMAGSEDRLTSIRNALESGMPSPLSSDPVFRACTGESASPTVLFVRFAPLLQVIRDIIPERGEARMSEIVNSLGLNKIAGIGYHEEGPNGIVIAKGSEAVPLFKLLKGKAGPPGIMDKMPADAVFAIGRTDEMGPHLQRIKKHLLDPTTFPFASDLAGGLDEFKAASGLDIENVLANIKGGIVFAGIPDEHGKFDEERSLVVVAKVETREHALALFEQMKTAAGNSSMPFELEQVEQDGQIWLRPAAASSQPAPAPESAPAEEEDPRAARRAARRARQLQSEMNRPKPQAVWNGEVMVVGLEGPVKRTLMAQAGQAPTLGSVGAFKRLPAQATFYVTTSLKSIFSQENDFAAALSVLKDFGNTGTSIVVEDDLVVSVSNRSGSDQISAILAAAAMEDEGRDVGREILSDLTEIGTRTKAYHEKHGKWPASLADLGYTAKDMPSGTDMDGKVQAIVFLPPKADADANDHRTLLAYFPSADYGRLAVSVAGSARRWAEADFLSALARYNTMK